MLVPRRVPVVHLEFLVTRRSFSLPKLTKGNESIPGKLKVAHQSYLYGPILLIRAIFCHLTLSLPWFICQPCRCSLCISLATLRCLLLPNVHFERVALESRSIEGLHRLLHLFWCLICSSCNATFVDLGKDAFTSLPRDHRKAVISNWNHWNQILFVDFVACCGETISSIPLHSVLWRFQSQHMPKSQRDWYGWSLLVHYSA